MSARSQQPSWRALRSGTNSLNIMKQVIVSSSPAASLFMELMIDDSQLPSLRQLDQSVSPELRDWLNFTTELS